MVHPLLYLEVNLLNSRG